MNRRTVIGIVIGLLAVAFLVRTIDDSLAGHRWIKWKAERDSLAGVATANDRARLVAEHLNAALRAELAQEVDKGRQLRISADSLFQATTTLRHRLADAKARTDTVLIVTTQDSLITELTTEVSLLRQARTADSLAMQASASLIRSLEDQHTTDSTEISAYRRLVSRAPAPRSGKLFGLIPIPRCGPGVALGTDLVARPALSCIMPL